MPVTSDRFDNELCNSMGTKCFDAAELVSFVCDVLKGKHPENSSRDKILSHHINIDDNKFACEIMLDEIGKFMEGDMSCKKAGNIETRLRDIVFRTVRFFRQYKSNKTKNDIRSAYVRRKVSDIDKTEITSRIDMFKSCLDNFNDVQCVDIGRDLFVIRKQACPE